MQLLLLAKITAFLKAYPFAAKENELYIYKKKLSSDT